MRATLMYRAGDVRVVEVPDPVIQEPTDAIVRITYACVCGSDLHPYHTLEDTPAGRRMGHESIGVVEQVGERVASPTPGDTVIIPFAWSDNTCAFCRDGITTSCVRGGMFDGSPSATQAEKVRVPQAAGTVVVIPEGTDDVRRHSRRRTGQGRRHRGQADHWRRGLELPLDDIAEGYRLMDSREALKVLIRP